MNTHTRRSFAALVPAIALFATQVSARIAPHAPAPLKSCGAPMSTPEIIRVESDIDFDMAYIDTTIPYQSSALLLTELAMEDIEDDRVIPIAEHILDSHPVNIEHLRTIREDKFGDPEPGEATHEKMLQSMGGMESCTDQSHMDFMDAEWIKKTFEKNEDPFYAYVSMIVLLMEMEMHQHTVGVELADDDELRSFCERLIETNTPYLKVLKEVRGELFTRY